MPGRSGSFSARWRFQPGDRVVLIVENDLGFARFERAARQGLGQAGADFGKVLAQFTQRAREIRCRLAQGLDLGGDAAQMSFKA